MGAYQGLGYKKNVIFTPEQIILYTQHIGADSYTLPDGSSTTKYILTRNLFPSSNYESDDSLAQSFTDTSEALVIDQRFYWWEEVIGDMYLTGDFFGKAKFGIAGDGTNTAYLTKVAFDVESLDSAGSYTTIASKTITFTTAPSTASTSPLEVDIAGLVKGSWTRFRMYKDLSFRVRGWGYVAGGTGTMYLYFTRGSDATYLVVNKAEG